MIRTQGKTSDYKSIEAVGKSGKVWHIRWDCQPMMLTDEDGNTTESGFAVWAEDIFYGIPTEETVRRIIYKYYNDITDNKILSGFIWKDMNVWLSTENQFNYKTTYDLAVQSDGASLPCTFKFGTDDEPIYHTFSTLDELKDFYLAAVAYVQQCYQDGWATKDAVDYSVYDKSKKEEEANGND